jgi:hypothetical protein
MQTLRVFKNSSIDDVIAQAAGKFWQCFVEDNNCKYPVWGYDSFEDFMLEEAGVSIQRYSMNAFYEVTIHDPEKWLLFVIKWS